MAFLAVIGRVVISFLRAAGRIGLFAVNAVKHIFLPPFYPCELFRQMMNIGYYFFRIATKFHVSEISIDVIILVFVNAMISR